MSLCGWGGRPAQIGEGLRRIWRIAAPVSSCYQNPGTSQAVSVVFDKYNGARLAFVDKYKP